MNDEPTYYERLRVSPDASPAEIRAAYRALAWQWHPDRSARLQPSGGVGVLELGPDPHAAASRYMAHINAAYDVLRDPYRRAAYDAALRDAAQELRVMDTQDLSSQISALRRQRTSVVSRLRSESFRRWLLGTLVAASSIFLIMWIVAMLVKTDHDVFETLRDTESMLPLADTDTYPHLLDGEPLNLAPTADLRAPMIVAR